jgi:hypothetical protein
MSINRKLLLVTILAGMAVIALGVFIFTLKGVVLQS